MIKLTGFRDFLKISEGTERKAPENKGRGQGSEESLPDDIFGGMEDQFNIEPGVLQKAIEKVPIIQAWNKVDGDDVGLEPVLIKPGMKGGRMTRIPSQHDGSRVFRNGKRDWHPERHKGKKSWIPRGDEGEGEDKSMGMATLYAQGLPGWDGQPVQPGGGGAPPM